MHEEILRFLRCPDCGGDLTLFSVEEFKNNEVISGKIKCSDCSTTFNINNGIIDFLSCVDQTLREEMIHFDDIAKGNKARLGWVADHEVYGRLQPSVKSLILEVVKGMVEKENAIVLEICCGEGTAVGILSDVARKVHYVGVDISQGLLAHARERKRHGWKINLIRGDANRQLLKPDVVDVCFSFAALHHLEPHNAMQSISSSLKEGGYFILYEPNRYNMFNAIGRNLIRGFHTKKEKPLSPFTTRAIARSFKMLPLKEQGLYPVGYPTAFLMGFLKHRYPAMAKRLRTLALLAPLIDNLLSRKPRLNLLFSSNIFQCFIKANSAK